MFSTWATWAYYELFNRTETLFTLITCTTSKYEDISRNTFKRGNIQIGKGDKHYIQYHKKNVCYNPAQNTFKYSHSYDYVLYV